MKGTDKMKMFSVSNIFSMKYGIKEKIASGALLALGVAFEMTSKRIPELRKEISGWEEGRTFSLAVLPHGPSITMIKKGNVIKYLGTGIAGSDLIIYFKNIDSALMTFLGLIGSHTASAQGRTIVHGDIGAVMQIARAMNIVQLYLMPGMVIKKTYKRPPVLSSIQLMRKAAIYAELVPCLLLNMSRKTPNAA